MTNLDQSGRERLEPRPVSRPPVDPASHRAFGRPDGVNGSFVGLDRYRDQGEYAPKDQAPDPVLAEAFGRPYTGGDSLQRHPADAGALEAERDGQGVDQPDDPWRIPRRRPRWAPRRCPDRSTGPVDRRMASSACATCCSRQGVYVALAVQPITALLISLAGGWVGRKTARSSGVHHVG